MNRESQFPVTRSNSSPSQLLIGSYGNTAKKGAEQRSPGRFESASAAAADHDDSLYDESRCGLDGRGACCHAHDSPDPDRNCLCFKKSCCAEGRVACNDCYFFSPAEGAFAAPTLFQPWKRDMSPAFHASRSPGVLRSQSGRISLVTARRSCQRSATDGRPQNQ